MYEINNYQRRNQYRLVPKMASGGGAKTAGQALGKSGLGLIDKGFRQGVRNIKRAYNKWFGGGSKEASKAASGNTAAGNAEKASTTGASQSSENRIFAQQLRENPTLKRAYNEANRKVADRTLSPEERAKWNEAIRLMMKTGKPYRPKGVKTTALTPAPNPNNKGLVHQPNNSKLPTETTKAAEKTAEEAAEKTAKEVEEAVAERLYSGTKSSWRKKALLGAGILGIGGAGYLLAGDSNAQTPEVPTIDDIDVTGPAIVDTGGAGGDGTIGGNVGGAVGEGDATTAGTSAGAATATDAREIESSTRLGGNSTNASANSSANASANGTGAGVGEGRRRVIRRSIYDTMPLMNRRDVRHVLRDLTGRAYTSSAVELVNSLGMTEDTNPFKKALMNRLGVKNWNNRLVLQKLGEKGIHGTLGGKDRKRIRNLINNGTLIDGSIRYYKKNGGTLKLVPKKY